MSLIRLEFMRRNLDKPWRSRSPSLESGERTVGVAEKAGRRARLLVGGFGTRRRRGQGQLFLCGVHSVGRRRLLLFLFLLLFLLLLFLI